MKIRKIMKRRKNKERLGKIVERNTGKLRISEWKRKKRKKRKKEKRKGEKKKKKLE
jgi:hypothetical protein